MKRPVLYILILLGGLWSRGYSKQPRFIDSLQSALVRTSADTDRCDILNKLSFFYLNLDPEKAEQYHLEAADCARRAHDRRRSASVEFFTAMKYSHANMFDSARPHLLFMIREADALHDEGLKLTAYLHLGWNGGESGDYAEAMDLDLKALDIATKLKDTLQIAEAYNNIANLYMNRGDTANVLSYLRLSLHFKTLTGDSAKMSSALCNLGICLYRNYLDPQHLDSALLYLRAGKAIMWQTGDYYNYRKIGMFIGQAFERMNNLDSALANYRQAIDLHRASNEYTVFTADVYNAAAHIFLLKDEPDSAEYYAFLARDLYVRLDAKAGLVEAYRLLSEIYAAKKNYRQAFEYGNKYVQLVDSLFNITKMKIINEMDVKYQSSQKEKEIAERNEELKQQRIINYGILGVAGFLCIPIALIYRSGRQKKRINKDLKIAKDRAETSEQYEKQFLANMSHEIRTPMNAVMGMTNLLLDLDHSAKQRNYLDAIKKSSENLLVIINDILDLSKLKEGKMELERIPFRLSTQIEHAIDILRFKADEKGLMLRAEIGSEVPEIVIGDPGRLNQILLNLIGNAIKFTEKGSVLVTVSGTMLSEDSASIRFSIRDTGIGIPQEKLATIFESFKQAEAHTSRKYGGTGLGLSISKTLVELAGGKLEVDSKIGEGSEFYFTIPLEIGSPSQLQKTSVDNQLIDPHLLAGIRILVAEDNEYNQIVLADTLKLSIPNIHLAVASNGKEAIELLADGTFDLVLMDVQMPELDGLEATRYIRTTMNRDIPIIALTASVIRGDIDECLRAGMNDYVPKPFTREVLFGTLLKYYRGAGGPAST
ncbi:MAG: ATP-binding protein [Bacteroidota bacterium]|nr:ATP-binding protein [Bacteroidota bacterium]MDP4235084.1 ATP-binding protein [Bacteroidota bacterium]